MNSEYTPVWLADGGPDRMVIVLAGVDFYLGIWMLNHYAPSWRWLTLGFVVTIILMGPVAATAIAARIRTWFGNIGGVRRLVLIIGSATVITAATNILNVPPTIQINILVGLLFASSLMVWGGYWYTKSGSSR